MIDTGNSSELEHDHDQSCFESVESRIKPSNCTAVLELSFVQNFKRRPIYGMSCSKYGPLQEGLHVAICPKIKSMAYDQVTNHKFQK